MKRLPRGRHGLPDEFVSQNQRERLIVAVAECLYESGYDKTTVSRSRRTGTASPRATSTGTSRAKDACFLAAYDAAVGNLRERVLSVCESNGDWAAEGALGARGAARLSRQRARSGEPAAGRRVSAAAARSTIASRRRCGASSRPSATVPPLRPVASSRRKRRMRRSSAASPRCSAGGCWPARPSELGEFLPEVAEFALTPYLGAAEARRIISAG